MAAMPPHPAHVHSGTCDTLGAVVHPLNFLGMGTPMGDGPMRGRMMDGTPMAGPMMQGTPMPGGMMRGAPRARPVEASVTTIPASLDDLLDSPHAINVHWSEQEIDRYIACGEIGGTVVDSDLLIGLHELNASGAVGVAWLQDNGDSTTTVALFLAPGLFQR
jgi:hypothetical protein